MEIRLEGDFLYAIDDHKIKLHKEPTMQDYLLYAILQELQQVSRDIENLREDTNRHTAHIVMHQNDQKARR